MSRSRALAFGGVAAVAVGVVVAVSSAFSSASSGVAAAEATSTTRTVHVGGATVRVTQKPNGAVCFSGPGAASCASSLADSQLAYATGRIGGRVVLAGVAGAHVKAVIARLTFAGTVWPQLHGGAFYTVLPKGFRLRAIVKVLAGGRRVAFAA
jgi:streptogramin lyase